MMINYSIWRPMPAELQAQADVLHQKIMDALDRYDFEEALELHKQDVAIQENWFQQCLQVHQTSVTSGEGGSLAS